MNRIQRVSFDPGRPGSGGSVVGPFTDPAPGSLAGASWLRGRNAFTPLGHEVELDAPVVLNPNAGDVELGAFDRARDVIFTNPADPSDFSVTFNGGRWGAVFREVTRYAVVAGSDGVVRLRRWDDETSLWVDDWTSANPVRHTSTGKVSCWPALAVQEVDARSPARMIIVYVGEAGQVVVVEGVCPVGDHRFGLFQSFELTTSIAADTGAWQPVVAIGVDGVASVAWAEGQEDAREIRWARSYARNDWAEVAPVAISDPGGDAWLPSLATTATTEHPEIGPAAILAWRFDDASAGTSAVHYSASFGSFAFLQVNVLTASGRDSDPCVWASPGGRYWCAWTHAQTGEAWRVIQVATAPTPTHYLGSAVTVSGRGDVTDDGVDGNRANFVSGWAEDFYSVMVWEVGSRNLKKIAITATTTLYPESWARPTVEDLGVAADVYCQFPSVFGYDGFVQIFWVEGDTDEPAVAHLIEGFIDGNALERRPVSW